MRIIFMGTPDFSVPFLVELHKDHTFEIAAVVTQPDQPVGRHRALTPPAVKIAAQKLGIDIIQENNSQRLREKLATLKPDMLVVIAFGQILKPEIIKLAPHGAINIHASLLPKYRGASPIQESLLHGDTETGISIMQIDDKLDHGDIFLIKRISIEPEDNSISLAIKLSQIGSRILPTALKDIIAGSLKPIPQNHQNASYCHKIEKNNAQIDWQEMSATEILNRLRAYTPWPGIHCDFHGKKLKILDATISQSQIPAGKFIPKDNLLEIGCKKGSLSVNKLQPEGKKALTASEFINGYRQFLDS